MKKDLYEILGIQQNASDDEIKKAFKKMALKYHPDRQKGKTDEQIKDAEEKFKEVNKAYSVLSDPQKKQMYDQFGVIDDEAQMSSGGPGGFDFDFFGDFFGRHSNPFARQQQQKQAGQSVRLRVGIDISEIMNGINREIEYDSLTRCHECNGKGGKDIQTCPHCNGTGMITRTVRSMFGIQSSTTPCQHCGGTGQTIKEKCHKCDGSGFERVKKFVKLNVSGPLMNKQQVYMRGMGYESKDAGMPAGDLLVELIYAFDENTYQVYATQNKLTIYEKLSVKWYDCMLGTKLEKTLPNGKTVTIEVPQCSQEGQKIKALTTVKYDYIYVVDIVMPKYLNKKEKELLNEIRQINKT